MDLGNAKFLLKNLIGRMEQEGDAKRWKLEGSISTLEMDALQTILEELLCAIALHYMLTFIVLNKFTLLNINSCLDLYHIPTYHIIQYNM